MPKPEYDGRIQMRVLEMSHHCYCGMLAVFIISLVLIYDISFLTHIVVLFYKICIHRPNMLVTCYY